MSGDGLESVGDEAQSVTMESRRCVGGFDRRMYSRSEMEALRYLDVDSQRRKWSEVCSRLDEVVVRGLRAWDNQTKGRQGKIAGKKHDFRTVGEVNLLSQVKDSGIFISSDFTCGQTLIGAENYTDKEVAYCEASNTWEYEIVDDDNDSDEEFNSIQKPAFLVEGKPDFDSGTPLDGFEYIRRVRWEAARFPKVKVAQLKTNVSCEQTPYMPFIPDIAECPQNLLPSKLWEDTFLADFSKLRQAFSEYEASLNSPSLSTTEISLNPSICRQKPKGSPTLTAILSMDSASRASVLRSSIRSFDTSSALSRADCLWLYALSATVDAPLDADTCASVRCMLRKCSSLLAAKSDFGDEVAMLSILIVIAGKYFRQSEHR